MPTRKSWDQWLGKGSSEGLKGGGKQDRVSIAIVGGSGRQVQGGFGKVDDGDGLGKLKCVVSKGKTLYWGWIVLRNRSVLRPFWFTFRSSHKYGHKSIDVYCLNYPRLEKKVW